MYWTLLCFLLLCFGEAADNLTPAQDLRLRHAVCASIGFPISLNGLAEVYRPPFEACNLQHPDLHCQSKRNFPKRNCFNTNKYHNLNLDPEGIRRELFPRPPGLRRPRGTHECISMLSGDKGSKVTLLADQMRPQPRKAEPTPRAAQLVMRLAEDSEDPCPGAARRRRIIIIVTSVVVGCCLVLLIVSSVAYYRRRKRKAVKPAPAPAVPISNTAARRRGPPQWTLWQAVHEFQQQGGDQLALRMGDKVYIHRIFDDGWATGIQAYKKRRAMSVAGVRPTVCLLGFNQRTKKAGFLPLVFCQPQCLATEEDKEAVSVNLGKNKPAIRMINVRNSVPKEAIKRLEEIRSALKL